MSKTLSKSEARQADSSQDTFTILAISLLLAIAALSIVGAYFG